MLIHVQYHLLLFKLLISLSFWESHHLRLIIIYSVLPFWIYSLFLYIFGLQFNPHSFSDQASLRYFCCLVVLFFIQSTFTSTLSVLILSFPILPCMLLKATFPLNSVLKIFLTLMFVLSLPYRKAKGTILTQIHS